jgi:ABC-type glycerol-3-phosphate transport system substrate-binding protein
MIFGWRPTLRTLAAGALVFASVYSSLVPFQATRAASAADTPSLVVWTDATRLPAVQLYAKSHPKVNVKAVTVDVSTQITKLRLMKSSGQPWPDVIWELGMSTGISPQLNYDLDLTPYVAKSIVAGFAPGTLNICFSSGKLYCLRSDLAQDVLWYNKTLMKQFGYAVPTTWEQYAALGARVAKEHPGYVIGAFGDQTMIYVYFQASGCPNSQLVAQNTVRINLADPMCMRAANLLDPLLANGTIPKTGPYDAEYTKKYGLTDKVLMMPHASWFGPYIFKPAYKVPNGQVAAAPPLRWADEKTNWAGDVGGGAWSASRLTKYPQAAADLITWLTTSNDYQATAPTYPAYRPAAAAWANTIAHDPFYASNPFPVLQQAASLIRPGWDDIRYNLNSVNSSIVAAVQGGTPLAKAFPAAQQQLESLAKLSGYIVVH